MSRPKLRQRPKPAANGQLELVFHAPTTDADGAEAEAALAQWRAERARDLEALCQRMALPVGREAEVRLAQGPVLRGLLRLADETLWLDGHRDRLLFQIGATTFRVADIESVVKVEP